MPTYDYLCVSCHKKFSVRLTCAAHDRHRAKCPKCGHRKLQQRIVGFSAMTTKKS